MKRARLNRVSKSPKRQAELKADALWKAFCLGRDGHICRVCGKPANVVHHIWRKAKGLYAKLRHVITNGISLCGGCHFTIHMDAERGRDMVIKAIGQDAYDQLKERALLSKTDSSKYDPNMAIIELTARRRDG